MSHKQNDEYFDDLLERRGVFLSEYGLDEKDVMQDEKGTEYVMIEGENGLEKTFLPEKLQRDYVPF